MARARARVRGRVGADGAGRPQPFADARIAFALLDRQEELAQLESADTGKPINAARARRDAAAVARYFEFYAGAVDKLHGQTIPTTPASPC